MKRQNYGMGLPLCLVLIASIFLWAGCYGSPSKEREAENIEVITTIFPLADMVRRVGGDKVEVTNLLEAGDSPHTFEPTMEQARQVARADLLFYVGKGLDDWAVSLGEEEGIYIVEVTDWLKEDQVLDYEPVHLENNEHEHHHCQHDHGPEDPHVWMDPILVKEHLSPLITENLTMIKPEQEDYFTGNLHQFQGDLQELDREIKEKVENFSQKEFITYHSAWNYYAHRYGLVEVAAVEEFPGREPSAKWLSELVELAEEHGLGVIFAEPQLREENARVIAEEIDGEVLILDPLGGEDVPGRDSYLDLIRYNTEIFQQALE